MSGHLTKRTQDGGTEVMQAKAGKVRPLSLQYLPTLPTLPMSGHVTKRTQDGGTEVVQAKAGKVLSILLSSYGCASGQQANESLLETCQ